MATIIPRYVMVTRAIRWISEERVARPEEKLARIVDEAGWRFDLTPAEEAWLRYTFGR